jgi:hypothetical protein
VIGWRLPPASPYSRIFSIRGHKHPISLQCRPPDTSDSLSAFHMPPLPMPLSLILSGWSGRLNLMRPWTRRITNPLAVVILASIAIVPAASAVLIAGGDGTGNTTAPSPDPGFDHVGVINGLSGVYVRNGWVLTAHHVGVNPILLGGVTYPVIPGSKVRFKNPDLTLADLAAFKLAVRPPLTDLLIANNAPTLNTNVTMIGNGRNRGAATTFSGHDGFLWDVSRALRWGTSRITQINRLSLDTQSLWVTFEDLPPSPGNDNEADMVTGDSGGAAFTGSGSSAELVGILFARATLLNQPANTSIYGNAGIIADLFAYRSEILAVIDQPDCDDGLDDDGDGLIDFPADPGCSSLTDSDERNLALACDNGLDDDTDGLTDMNDPGCSSPSDISERGASFQCDNGLDDDGDLLVDFPDDDGCLHPTNLIEAPEPSMIGLLTAGVLGITNLAARRRRSQQRRAAS